MESMHYGNLLGLYFGVKSDFGFPNVGRGGLMGDKPLPDGV